MKLSSKKIAIMIIYNQILLHLSMLINVGL